MRVTRALFILQTTTGFKDWIVRMVGSTQAREWIMKKLVIAAACAIVVACGAGAPELETAVQPSPGDLLQSEQSEPQSLFPGDAEVLSDSAIRRILAYEIELPPQVRIAVLQLGSLWSYRRWWSHELAELSTQVNAAFQERLGQSPRVASVDHLPLLLIPEQQTVPRVREAAARFRADLLLVYQPVCGIFERSRFLRANQFRVVCTIEAILLDTRSGIVPFSGFANGEEVTQKSEDDFDLRETEMRAQLEVGRVAVLDLAEQIAQYLDSVKQVSTP
jgi:hypothetical protein